MCTLVGMFLNPEWVTFFVGSGRSIRKETRAAEDEKDERVT